MIKWGILSTAKIATEQIIPAITESKNSIIRGIASRDIKKAKKISKQFDIPKFFGTYDELLNCKKIDAIYIPLPTSQHVEWSIKSLKAKKHVLCEKPIALNVKEIDRINLEINKSNKIFSEAFMVYYHPQWKKVKELILSGEIGELKHVQGCFTYFNIDPKNMRNIPELGGGVLPDIGVYPLVTTRMVTEQEPIKVSSKIKYDKKFMTDIYASVEVTFKNFDLSFYVSTQMSLSQKMIFHGSTGKIEIHAPFNARLYGDAIVSLSKSDNSEKVHFRFGETNQYKLQIEAFADAIKRNDNSDLFSIQNSRNNQKIIDKIFQSYKKQKVLKI